MAKFYYKYGTMGGGKTLDLIRCAKNYQERGLQPLLLKPRIDTRDGIEECIIASRTGDSMKADWIEPEESIISIVKTTHKGHIDAIIIDECQFLSKSQILDLSDLVTDYDIPVIAYGLKSDFKGDLFPAIATLLVYADSVEEIKSICWCGKKATQNARVIDGKVVKTGNQIEIGGNELYVPLCTKHWKKNQLNNRRQIAK